MDARPWTIERLLIVDPLLVGIGKVVDTNKIRIRSFGTFLRTVSVSPGCNPTPLAIFAVCVKGLIQCLSVNVDATEAGHV